METDDQLEAILARNEQWIAESASPDAYEIVGRIRRHRGESGWQDLIRQAVVHYIDSPKPDNMSAANLSRILGENEDARMFWQRALEHSESSRAKTSLEKTEMLICTYFLDSEQFESHAQACGKGVSKHWPLLDLWHAKRAGDVDALRKQLAVWERKARGVTIATNRDAPSEHDMVEHIQDLLAQLQ